MRYRGFLGENGKPRLWFSHLGVYANKLVQRELRALAKKTGGSLEAPPYDIIGTGGGSVVEEEKR